MDSEAVPPDVTAGPADAEFWLVDWLRLDAAARGARSGWAHSCLAGLLLAHGRLFTPAPWPDGEQPPGEPGKCFIESVSWAWASGGELAYVEGWAWDLAFPVEHAWCAAPDGVVRDLTWPRPGAAYLGLPVVAEAAAALMGEHGGPLLHANGAIGPVAESWMRGGVPAGLLVDVGRPLPAG
ncbi:hypothetical protein HW130_32195 [Streptomyces sp. PKU-EA00015]|uniref:hypothetical protein n=1 Tax=Streptomyces sp. PKU-EA00015 TaxID=2748326 RepID=UPI0015A1587D|nr:hypothetical protein [Streptomyces sp. PKU-EA00015]NWF30855.1 hypothetical protein [Streptomyces sp. PKU-EA00015]